MASKRSFQLIMVVAIFLASFMSTRPALAWYCSSYITVQWGDTLSGLAATCGTTMDAIRAANPGLGWWVYAGQVLYIPTGTTYTAAPVYTATTYTAPAYTSSAGGTYTVQWGDTLGIIAGRMGVTVNAIMAVNPQIWNASLIYVGQVINLPAAAPVYYTVCSGDTMRIIAAKYGTSVYNLQVLNPQIYDANLIYPGQVMRVW